MFEDMEDYEDHQEEILDSGDPIVSLPHELRPGVYINQYGMSVGPCIHCGKRWEDVKAVPIEECPGRVYE
jgi:hypothetical protein